MVLGRHPSCPEVAWTTEREFDLRRYCPITDILKLEAGMTCLHRETTTTSPLKFHSTTSSTPCSPRSTPCQIFQAQRRKTHSRHMCIARPRHRFTVYVHARVLHPACLGNGHKRPRVIRLQDLIRLVTLTWKCSLLEYIAIRCDGRYKQAKGVVFRVCQSLRLLMNLPHFHLGIRMRITIAMTWILTLVPRCAPFWKSDAMHNLALTYLYRRGVEDENTQQPRGRC